MCRNVDHCPAKAQNGGLSTVLAELWRKEWFKIENLTFK